MRRDLVSNYHLVSSLHASIKLHYQTEGQRDLSGRQNANLRVKQLHQRVVLGIQDLTVRTWHG